MGGRARAREGPGRGPGRRPEGGRELITDGEVGDGDELMTGGGGAAGVDTGGGGGTAEPPGGGSPSGGGVPPAASASISSIFLRCLFQLPLDLVAPLQLFGVQGDGIAELLERLAERVVELNLVLHVRGRLADVPDDLPEPGRELGQLLGAKENQRQEQDDGDLAHPEVEHDGKSNTKETSRRPSAPGGTSRIQRGRGKA